MLGEADLSARGVFSAQFQSLGREPCAVEEPPADVWGTRAGHLRSFLFEPHFAGVLDSFVSTVGVSG